MINNIHQVHKCFVVRTLIGDIAVHLEWPENAASWYYRFFVRGKRVYKSAHTRDVRDAARTAKKAAEDAADKPTTEELPVADAITQYLNARWPDKEGDTYKDHKGRLNAFATAHPICLGKSTMDDMTAAVQAYIEHRTKDCEPQTVKNDQLVLSRFCGWLLKRRPRIVSWQANPANAELLELPPREHHALPPIPPSEQRRLLAAVDGTELLPPVALCLGAGLRPIEALRNPTIDREQKIAVVTAKRRGRVVPLLPEVLSCVNGSVWEYHPDYFSHWLAKRGKGLPGLQACRRTAAFRISREVDAMTYARIMGHSLEVAQNHYLYFDALSIAQPETLHPRDWTVGKTVGGKS